MWRTAYQRAAAVRGHCGHADATARPALNPLRLGVAHPHPPPCMVHRHTLLTRGFAVQRTKRGKDPSSSLPRSYRTVPSAMAGEATAISQEFEFDGGTGEGSGAGGGAGTGRSTFLRRERPKPNRHTQQHQQPQKHELLKDAVSQLKFIRQYAVRTPCHASSLFSLPVLNQLRGILHARPFVKMVIRASIAPNDWSVAPEWDFDPKLEIPTSRSHSNWMIQQELMNITQPNPSIIAAGTPNKPDNTAVTASQPEPFTKVQIERNISDFTLSPHLHQSQEILDAVMQSQKKYFDLADRMARDGAGWSDMAYASHDKRIKKSLNDAWVHQNPTLYRALVGQFLKFMDEPIDDSIKQHATPDEKELAVALSNETQQTRSHGIEMLLKSRSGRLCFDPSLVGLSNLSAPHEWYEVARSITRKFIIHVGPTNSGKTYHAMQRLMGAGSGVYAGPLRLLAWEVYDKMCKAGVPCNLRTGQESQDVDGAMHTSSTVEMLSTTTVYDVAVIDECQMLSANDRGWAWTRALLGVAAYEIHVCGDPSMVGLVEELAAITGEEVEVREYERLTPLVTSPPLRNGIKEIRKGDCIVAFSQKMLYRLKHDIEHQLGLKCCIIYGSLPPETRRDQADKFNSPDSGYDVLVATDAIGMGLNLNIQRVIFARMDKFDGFVHRALTVSETLQIAGRAGRFNTGAKKPTNVTTMAEAAESNTGYVTTLQADDHAYLIWALAQKLQPIERAGLAPTQEQLQTLHELRPKEKLSNLVTYFAQYAQLDQVYFNVDMDSFKAIADLIETVPFSTLSDRYCFCRAPTKPDGGVVSGAIVRFAELFAAKEKVYLKSYKVPAIQLPTSHIGISAMEDLYAITELYVWLGLKFGDEIFVDIYKAMELRKKTAAIIQAGLERMSPSESYLADRRIKVAKIMKKAQLAATQEEEEEVEEGDRSMHTPPSVSSKPPPTARMISKPFVGPRKDRPVHHRPKPIKHQTQKA